MNKSLQKLMCNVIAVVMLVTSVFSGNVFAYSDNVSLDAATEPTGTIWTIGDSTVCEYTAENVENYNYRQGWGMRLGDYFNSKATVKNIAKSGRSARDFKVYGKAKDSTDKYGPYYTDFITNLKAGDYVLIQFGHNDSKEPLIAGSTEGTYACNGNYGKTDAEGGISSAAGLKDWQTKADENGYLTVEGVPSVENTCTEGGKVPSFEAILWKDYVKFALDKGAYPVLVTPVVRGQGTKVNGILPTITKIDESHTKTKWKVIGPLVSSENLTEINYVQGMYDVQAYAKSLGYDVPVVDLYERSCTYWLDYISKNGDANALHANDKGDYANKGKDRTHLSREGALAAAGLVCDSINEQNLPLAKLLKVNSPEEPTETTTDKTETTTNKTETTTNKTETTTNKTETTTEFVEDRGDFDEDGIISVNDASILLTYVLDKVKYLGSFSDEMIKYLGDVNGDGNVTAEDVAQILKKALSDDEFKFSGKPSSKPSVEDQTKGEEPTETTTAKQEDTTSAVEETETVSESATESTTEATTEGTTEAVVEGDAQDAVYEGYDLVVDARANTDATREGQPIFKTVREAVAAASEGTEDNPTVIGIVPGVYREHIRVNKPYITFKKITNSTSEAEDATLTWYWLTNYTYDNIGADGDVDMSMPNTEANESPNTSKMPNWGRSTWIQRGATGFRAEGIYFENSANLYVTQEELDANVRPISGTGKPERNDLAVGYGTEMDKDVRTRKYRERGCALYTEADKVVFENCKVISTQDTLGTDGRALFNNCYLAGCVDFICGGGQILFNNCNIHWQSSPYEADSGDRGGPLTAAHTDGAPAKGYLFYNCRVSGEQYTEQCNFGRPWAGKTTETVWVNTTADISKVNNKAMISDKGWAGMGCEPQDARGLFEYNSKDANGNPLDTSKRIGTTNERFTGGVLDEFTVVRYNPYEYTAYTYPKNELDGWDPLNVASNWKAIEDDAKALTLSEGYAENFTLPEAPEGYEVSYYVDNNFVKISADGKTAEVTRPLFGQPDADVDFTYYLKKAGTIEGVEGTLSTKVLAREDATGTFTAKGNVNLTFASDSDLKVTLTFNMASGFKADELIVDVPAGTTSVPYEVLNLPAAEYNVTVALGDNKFAVVGGEVKNFTGVAGEDTTLDIQLGKLEKVSKAAGDLAGAVSSGYTMEKVTDSTLNEEVYHFVKEASASLDASQKYVWDLATISECADDLAVADSVTINFKVRVPNSANWNTSLMNYFDIVGGDVKDYAGSADSTRYVRFRVGGNWIQMDAIRNDVGGWSGSSNNDTQKLNIVGKFNADTWRNVSVTLDFKNEQVKFEGSGGSFYFEGLPKDIDRSKLNFVIYPQDSSGLANNEYYITKPVISFDKFVAAEDTSVAYAVSGTSENITAVKLVNVEQALYTHDAIIGEDGAISFAKDIPAGKYKITYTLAEGAKFKEVTGTGVELADGNYYITISDKAISDLSVVAEKVAGFKDAEDAIVAAFDAAYEKVVFNAETGDTGYKVNTAVVIPKATGYTIEIVAEDGSAINSDGSLNRPAYKEGDVRGEIKFKITNNATTDSENYTLPIYIEEKDAKFFYRDFEEVVAGTVDEGVDGIDGTAFAGEIVNVAGRGNVVKFTNFKKDGTQADGGKLVVGKFDGMDDGIYSISFDVMKDDISNRGWRLQFGSYIDLLFDTKNVNVSTSGSVGGCGGYSDSDVYGASKNLISNAAANEWYNITLVTNNKTGHVDAYLGGEYVTSYKGVAGKLPDNLMFQSYWGANHQANIYVDNIKVEKLDEDFDSEFDENVSSSAIPTEILASDQTITLPTRIAGKTALDVNWSSDKSSDVIEITKGEGYNTVDVKFKAQQSATTATLKALITGNLSSFKYPGCQNEGVVNTISHERTYTINFAKNATESFTVSGSVDFDFAPSKDVQIKIAAVQNEEEKASTTVTVSEGTKTANYTISDLVPGSYNIVATILTEGTKNVVKNNNFGVAGKNGETQPCTLLVGEMETKTYTLDFEESSTFGALPKGTATGNDDEKMTVAVVQDPGNEENNVLKIASNGGNDNIAYSWLLSGLFNAELSSCENVTVSYKIMNNDHEKIGGYIDIGEGLGTQLGKTKYANDKLFVRTDLGMQWDQFNMENCLGTQARFVAFGAAKLEGNVGNWYTTTVNIDTKNKFLSGGIVCGSNEGKFDMATGTYNSSFGGAVCTYPTGVSNLNDLVIAFYPKDKNCEWYIDDISISYEALKEEVKPYTVSCTGLPEVLTVFNLKAEDGTVYEVIDNEGSFYFEVPAGRYEIEYVKFEGAMDVNVTGFSGENVTEEGGKYYIQVDGNTAINIDTVDVYYP